MTIPIARRVPGFSGSTFVSQAGRALVLSFAVLVAACGGGGGDGVAAVVVPPVPATTAIDGNVAPQGNLAGVTSLTRSDMLLPPNAGSGTFVAIVQNVYSVFDLTAAPELRVKSLTFRQADVDGTLELQTGAATYANDAALGQLTATATSGPDGSRVSLFVTLDSLDTIGNLQTALYCQSCDLYAFGIVLPFSATANPNGYSFQTFGAWGLPFRLPGGMLPNIDGDIVENWFSVGIPTVPVTLPVGGTASYAGQSGGSFVDTATRDPSDIAANVSATVDSPRAPWFFRPAPAPTCQRTPQPEPRARPIPA